MATTDHNARGQLARSTAFSTPTYNWGGTTTYAYDKREQLTSESSTRGAGYSHNFGYSGAANPTMWKGQTRSFNANNQETTGNAFLYDGAGNTTQMPNGNLATPTTPAPTQKLIYNAQGQLAELRDNNNAVIATYVYRGDGKRAWKELANGQRSYFYYSGEMLIAGTNGIDSSGLQLWGADGLVGSRSFNSTTNVVSKSYNLYDTQGNLAQTIDAATGNVIGQSAVSAWGEPILGANGNASGGGYGAKFGYVRDGESGFYLCTLRYYDPSGGRWLTRDPIGYNGGSNLYGYVGNDPVNATDPSGLAEWVTVDRFLGVGYTHAYIRLSKPYPELGPNRTFGFFPGGFFFGKIDVKNNGGNYSPTSRIRTPDPNAKFGKVEAFNNDPAFERALVRVIGESLVNTPNYIPPAYVCGSWVADMWNKARWKTQINALTDRSKGIGNHTHPFVYDTPSTQRPGGIFPVGLSAY